MRYQLKPILCRPWLLNGLSLKLIESHYENNYGGALRRLTAITEQLESLDFAKTPSHVVNGLKREELVALNSARSPHRSPTRSSTALAPSVRLHRAYQLGVAWDGGTVGRLTNVRSLVSRIQGDPSHPPSRVAATR